MWKEDPLPLLVRPRQKSSRQSLLVFVTTKGTPICYDIVTSARSIGRSKRDRPHAGAKVWPDRPPRRKTLRPDGHIPCRNPPFSTRNPPKPRQHGPSQGPNAPSLPLSAP